MLCLLAALTVEAAGAEFRHSFIGNESLGPMLSFWGKGAANYAQLTPEGLVIAIPKSNDQLPPVGVVPRFRLHGDFEVTATYEFVEVELPTAGWGAGIMLWAGTNARARDGATVSRFQHAKFGPIFATDRTFASAAGRAQHFERHDPARGTQGKLRLARRKKTLHYSVADEGENEFREVRVEPFVSNDVSWLPLAVVTGGSKTAVAVRLLDLTYVAEKLPLANEPEDTEGGWIIWSLLSFLAVLTLSLIAALRLWSRPAARCVADAAK